MEARIATTNELSIERQLEVSGQLTVKRANELKVESNEEYDEAGNLLIQLRTQQKRIKEYWKVPKAAAHSAHSTICEREKEMLEPLVKAEEAIKGAMAKYHNEIERARKEAEEAAQKAKDQEMERLLEQAIEAEEAGDKEKAALNAAMAEMISDMKPISGFDAPKVKGVGVRKTWKARIVDAAAVPAYYNGIEIRKIDMTQVNALARMSKGLFSIPGIEFYEDSSVSVRA